MDNILVVDDEQQIRMLMKAYLEGAGYGCRVAEDVPCARRLLERHPFDLVLTDVNMPGESGIDLVRHVKTAFPETGVVMVSVIDNPNEAREALDLGVFGYIVKPFTRNTVLICVENAIKRRHLERKEREHLKILQAAVKKQTEELNEQLVFMQALMEAIPSPIFYKDAHGVYQGCNAAFERFLGLDRQAVIGKTVYDIAPQALADGYHDKDMDLIRRGGGQTYEAAVVYADGIEHDVIFNKATYGDVAGRTAGLVGVMVDITERKRSEEALRTSEEKYRQIVDNIGIGVALIGRDARVLEMNRQMNEWFPDIGPEKQIPCYQLFNRLPQDRPCEGCPTMMALATGKVHEAVVGAPDRAGKRCFRIIASPIHDKQGDVAAAIELVEDVTKKLDTERELQQSQKLEAIGQLAAGIAHEINTPIQYVGDNIRFLQEAFEDIAVAMAAYDRLLKAVKGETLSTEFVEGVEARIAEADVAYLSTEIPSAVEQSLEGVQQVSKIVRAMRQFSHPGTDRKVTVDINQALESTITVARNEWKYVADMETDFAPDLPAVPCLPGEVNQVFLNLIVNAAHAIGEATDGGRNGKGKITISTRTGDDAVIIRISDTGNGISEAIRTRIFDPFFTTKAVGKGTGQGLAIARGVVMEKHGGRLWFETENGSGTTFIVELPLTEASESGATADA